MIYVSDGLVLAWHDRQLDRRRLAALVMVTVAAGLSVALPARQLIFTRVSGAPVSTEGRSTLHRLTLAEQSLSLIRRYPWGVGIGAYLPAAAVETPGDYPVEPVHNIYLLATSELGLPGGLLWLALAVTVALGSRRARTPESAVLSAAVIGLLVMAAFDHDLWSLAPGRTLLWLFLGLWHGTRTCPEPVEG